MLGKLSVTVNGAEVGAESILLGVVTSIGGFLFGYDTGQISGMLLFPDFIDRFAQGEAPNKEFDSIIQSILVSLMSIGCLIGSLSGAYTADWMGRRRSLAFGVFIFIIGNIIQITAMRSWVHMMMGRFVAGLGVGNLSVGVPMFQSECSPREIRGAVVASYQLMITFGILISNAICMAMDKTIADKDASWRIIIGLGIAFSVPLGVGVLLVPESRRWLASRGNWDSARSSLARLRGMKDDSNNKLVEDDLNEMRKILEKERQVGQGSWLECFNPKTDVPKTVYRTLLGMAIHFLQQWTGVNYFFYYGATIFKSAGIDDPILTQLILGAVNVVMTFYGLYVVEKFGRRWPLFIGGLWQSAWLLVFAAIGTAKNPEGNSSVGIVLIVSGCMFIASFAGTWGPIAWVVIGESFPLRTRAKQASLATASNWLGNFMVAFLTPLATKGISYAYGFVFAGTNLAAALIVWFFLYESRMLSLENVDLMYSDPDIKPWNSSKWTPPGYITREQRDEAYFRRMSVADQEKPRHSDASHSGGDVRTEHV